MTTHLATAASQGDTLGSIISPAVTLAIILLLIVTRVRGRRLEPARLLTADLILIAVGIGGAVPVLHSTTLHGIDWLIGSADLLDSLIIGTIRGFTVRLYQRDGAPWYRYGPATVALWLLSILIRIALAAIASARHASPLIAGGDLLFMLGLALLCQNLMVIRRHRHPQARPSHPVEPADAALSRTGRPAPTTAALTTEMRPRNLWTESDEKRFAIKLWPAP
jgi:hypothetical protein